MDIWEANCCPWVLNYRIILGRASGRTFKDVNFLGYPFFNRALTICSSSSWASMVDEVVPALCWSVQTTAILWARGWWEVKSRYLSAWVGFLNTVVEMDTSLKCSRCTSRNGSFPSNSFSSVNWFLWRSDVYATPGNSLLVMLYRYHPHIFTRTWRGHQW